MPKSNQNPHYTVVAAVITRTSTNITAQNADTAPCTQIFAAQRPGPKPGREPNETNYKWEFPGGKIEIGETPEAALAREIREEFGANIIVGDFITTVNHEYKTFSITMHAFFCTLSNPNEKLELKEHLDSRWLSYDELMTLDWAAADKPIVAFCASTNSVDTKSFSLLKAN